MSLIVNRRDLAFNLYEVLDIRRLLACDRFRHVDAEMIEAIFDTAQSLAENEFLPFAAKLDQNEPDWDGTSVRSIPELKAAISLYSESGFFASSFDLKLSGMQLPKAVSMLADGMFVSANTGAAIYSFLTIAAANMLAEFGNEAQKRAYLPPMLEGRWFGTMCLSEPQAGSSLTDIKTKAVPIRSGVYSISGNKMWITGGDQDISENIVHMVLARVPGSPPGVKGISLFIVPKHRLRSDGSVAEPNNVQLAGLNHKMGQRGGTNALLNFGENGECEGYLVGEENCGLTYMFHMMNEARIGVGFNATMTGLAGYLYSLEYARNRPQGRHPHEKDPTSPPVMIIEHADVRRLLMAQKVFVEGALSLLAYCAFLFDEHKLSDDEGERDDKQILLDILTPIAKSWPSEFCLEANKHAIQVLGGYGYTREYPVERFYRDNRLNPIHEGTHGIHGLDLLGRKVRHHGGKALELLINEFEKAAQDARTAEELDEYTDILEAAAKQVRGVVNAVMNCEDTNRGLANATLFLDALGHVVIGWMWLRQATAAKRGLQNGNGADKLFYEGKLAGCKYFFLYEMPKAEFQLNLVRSLDTTCLSVDAEAFVGQ